jgi:hypothetical protein
VIRKSTAIRMMCLTLLAVLASFGIFNATAQPAHALTCRSTAPGGCTFSDVRDFGTYVCCAYSCPNGSETFGPCQVV